MQEKESVRSVRGYVCMGVCTGVCMQCKAGRPAYLLTTSPTWLSGVGCLFAATALVFSFLAILARVTNLGSEVRVRGWILPTEDPAVGIRAMSRITCWRMMGRARKYNQQ